MNDTTVKATYTEPNIVWGKNEGVDYKFNEDNLLKELSDYINNTYTWSWSSEPPVG